MKFFKKTHEAKAEDSQQGAEKEAKKIMNMDAEIAALQRSRMDIIKKASEIAMKQQKKV